MADSYNSSGLDLITPEQISNSFSVQPLETKEEDKDKKKEIEEPKVPDLITPEQLKTSFSTEPIKEPGKIESLAAKYKDTDINQMSPEDFQQMSYLGPQELQDLKQFRPDLMLPEDLERKRWEAEKAGQLKNNENEPGLLDRLGKGALSFAKGTLRGAENILNAPEPGASEEEIKQYAENALQTVKSFHKTAAELPENLAWGITENKEAGSETVNWVKEKLGIQEDPETEFRRHVARENVRSARAQYERETPNVYARWVKNPNSVAAIDSLIRASGAKDADPAVTRKMAEDVANQIASEQKPLDEEIALSGTFLDPTGLNLGEIGLAFKGLEAARGIPRAFRAATMTKEAQQAYNAERLAEQVDKASKTGFVTKAAGKVADTLEGLSVAAEEFKKARPLTSKALSFLPGAIVGSYEDKEHPLLGALIGGTMEKGALRLLKGVDLAKAASIPARVIADVGEARALSAGTGRTFEMAGASAESSPATQKLFSKGRQMDRLAKFLGDYGHDLPDMVAAGIATGIFNNEDPGETLKGIEEGIAYGALHKSIAKIVGKDYGSYARERQRKDKQNYQTLQQLDPATRENIGKLQAWDGVVSKAQEDVDEAQVKYTEAVQAKNPEDAAEWSNLLQVRQANLARLSKADVATREAFASHVADTVRVGVEAANGPFREGQKNVGIAVMTPDQIGAQLSAQNPTKTPEQIQSVLSSGHFYSGTGKGIEPGANIPEALRPSFEGMVFNPLKSTVVINTEHISRRASQLGESFSDAFSHEMGHALDAIPEWNQLFDSRELFDTAYRDLNGNLQAPTPGVLFSDKALVDLYWNNYLNNIKLRPGEKTQDEAKKRWAIENGHWDQPNDRLNETAVANYMKPEVKADLFSKGLSGATFDNLDSTKLHLLDWARTKTQNNLARKAIEGVLGMGGRDPYDETSSPATGAQFSPELMSAYRNALRSFRELHGQVSSSSESGRVMPMISPAKLIKDPSLRQKYGRDSGLFKTEFRATVFDKDGNAIGSTTLADPLVAEGTWGSEQGNLVQRSGYGSLPAELSGAQVPEGGSVRVSREIVLQPDGETPVMLSRKEIKQLVKSRAQIIRDAIDQNYQGEPNGFRPVSDDGMTYRGYFTPSQIKAIRALPEQIVPAKIKDTILSFNDLLQRGDGSRMLIDYAARMDDRGKAVSFSPKIYDLVPIGMHFSKDGNFLITTVSVSRMMDKLNLWGDRLPGRLAPWGGDKEAFFREFATKYLPNHLEKWTNPEGSDRTPVRRPGETDLDPNPEIAKEKKNIFNDFLNLTSNEFRDLNPDRTVVPRRKGDPRGKDPNRTIMSVRADAVADLLESSAHPLPISYELQKINYLPAREENPVATGNGDVTKVAKGYAENFGIPYSPHGAAVSVDEALAKKIADYYEGAKDDPANPEVRKAYTALGNEVVNQWRSFEKAGYTATPWTKPGQPYANSREMMEDVRKNKHLYYFQTEGGYGETGITDKMRAENPMLQASGIDFGAAKDVPVNDVFRVVHDIVGHGGQGYEFGPKGEFNAYLEHSRMFSDAARPALAAETLAQNSWVNYGPHLRNKAGNLPKKGEEGYIAPPNRPFAPQKNISLPREFIEAAEQQAKNAIDSQAQKPVNQEINQPIATDATEPTPQYLPAKGTTPEGNAQAQGAEQTDSQAGERERIRLHSGLSAVARTAQGADTEGVPGASKSAPERKVVESGALLEHAEEAGLLGDPNTFFKQWQNDGSEAGGEHQVSFPPGPDVIKRTYNPNYPTWADYFDSLNVHNALFPKAALTFREFQNVEGSAGVDIDGQKWPGGLYSVVSQPFLEISRGLSVPETDALMKTRGFYRVRPMEYYSPELGIHMTDLHGMNAVMLRDQNGKEFPYVIDSYIRPTGEKDAADVKRIEDQVGTKEGLSFLPAGKTESPEFKEWFGDSQVVDEEGKPRVMYHGTGAGFTKFDEGGYFAFDPEFADKFANRAASGFMAESEYAYNPKHPDEEQAEGFSMTPVIMPTYLKATNLFDANNPEHMRKIGKAPGSFGDYQQIENNQDRIKKAGFDGYYDYEYGTDRDKTGIYVYDPTQVKSATGNVGTYSSENADIRYLPAKKGDIPVQHASEGKEGSVGGDLDLVHFGAYGVRTADPKKMGKGSATSIDRSGLPKTYFYLNGTQYESGIQEQTPYLAKVDGNSIYDLDSDPLGLVQTNREAMDKAIQDAGFAGYLSRKKKGHTFDAVALFKKTKLSEALPTDVFSKKEAKRRMEAGGPEIDYAAQDEAFYGPNVSYR